MVFFFLQEAVALKGYTQLLSDVSTSVANVEAFEGNVTSRKFVVNMVKNVTKRLTEIQGNMIYVAKVSIITGASISLR